MRLPVLSRLLSRRGGLPAPSRGRPLWPRRPLVLERLEDRLSPAVNNWLGAVSGNWNTAANWSDGVPTTDDDVVIAALGAAYTVTVNVNATVNSVAVNSGDATLHVLASGPNSRTLTASNGATNSGTLLLDNATGGTGAATLTVTNGALTNTGVLTAQNTGGTHGIAGSLINDGTVNVNDNTSLSKTNGLFTNNGQFNVGATGTVTFGNTGTFTQAAGNLDVQGSFTLLGDTFNFNGGTITGNAILLTNSSTLNIGAGSTGLASFNFRGTGNAYSGDLAAGQTVRLQANGPNGAAVTAANGFTNAGNLILENLNSGAGAATFTVNSGTLTNAAGGLITTQDTTGVHAIAANLHNQGTVNINADTSLSKASGDYTNSGQWTIAASRTQSMGTTTGTFRQAAGTLDVQGAFNLSGDTFNFNGGVLTGNAPMLTSSALNFGPGATGSGAVALRGTGTFSGDIPAGFTVRLQASGLNGAAVTAANGFTNAGNLILENVVIHPTSSAVATFTVSSGTLTNAAGGVVTTQDTHGTHLLAANLHNQGTVNINANTSLNKASGVYTNSGQWTVAASRTQSMGLTGTFTQAAGTLDVQGAFNLNADTFNLNGGVLTGNAPVLTSSALNFGPGATGPGATVLHGAGTLSGDIPTGFTVRIEATGANAEITAASGFTSHGTIVLTDVGSTSFSTLEVTSGTLTNAASGTIIADSLSGISFLTADVVNHGAIDINNSLSLNKDGGQHTNAGTINLVARTLTVTGTGASLTNAAAGLIAGAGTLNVNAATFTNHGTLSPGFSAGVLPITGALTQGSGGTVRIELGGVTPGTDFDRLTVSGNAALTGTLDVSLINGFVPTFGQSFQILNYGSRTGEFTTINGLNVAPGVVLRPLYSATNLILAVDGTPVINDADLVLSSGTISENNFVILNGSFRTTDPSDAHTVVIDWGDGSANTTISRAPGVFTFQTQHQYLDDNPTGTPSDDYSISVRVTDDDGASDNVGATVTVNNKAPSPAIAGAPTAVVEGTAVNLTGSFTDQGTQDTHGPLSWGVTKNGNPYASGTGASFSFTPDSVGTYVVTLSVTDDDGEVGTTSRTITATEAVITAAISGAPATGAEGTLISLTGSASDATATLRWNVTKNGSPYGGHGVGASFGFAPDDNGSYVVTLTATTANGLTGTDSKTIAVSNVNPAPAITGVPTSVTEGTAISLGVNPNDPGSRDTHTFAWSVTKNGMSFATGSGATFTFTPDDNGTYVVSVTVTDNGGDSGSDSKTIAVTNVNPTAVISGAPASSPEGTAISLTGAVSDPGSADTHTLVWSVTRDGSAVASGTGSGFSFTPDDNGTYVVTFTATDDDDGVGTDSKLIAVANVAPAPVITGAPASSPEGTAISLGVNPNDTGVGDTHTFAWSVTKDGAAFDSGSGATLTFTPNDNGTYVVSVTVTDNGGDSGSDSKTIAVTNVNPTAVISGAPASSPEGTAISFSGFASDPGSADTRSFEWSVTKNGTPYANGTGPSIGFTPDDNGIYAVTLTATDDDGGSGSTSKSITVTNVNPTAQITGAPASSLEGTAINLGVNVIDPGSADTHTFAWTVTRNSSPYASGSGGSFSFTPDDDGSYAVTLTATDDDGGTGTDIRIITVDNASPTATITGAPADSPEGTAINLTGSVSDPGTDTHTFAWRVFKDGSLFTTGAGTGFTFTPDDNGSYVVTLTATDDDGAVGTDTETISVTNVNPVAAITGAPAGSPEGTAISPGSSITDPGSADTHTLAWSVTKDGAPFANGSGTGFSFRPDDNGTYVVTLTATDDDGAGGSDTKTITVTNVDPTATITGAPATGPEGTAIVLTGSVSDPGSADTHAQAWSVTKDGSPFASGSGSNFTFTPDDDGTYVVTVMVTDDDGGTSADSKTITVANAAPTATITGTPAGSPEGTAIHLTASASDPGSADTHAFAWTVTKDGSLHTSGSGTSFTFTPDDDSVYVVTLAATDDDGGVGTAAESITVANMAPQNVSAGPDQTVTLGGGVTLTVTYTDPGSADTHAVRWTVTDGTGQVVAQGDGPSFTFVPPAAGLFMAAVTVTDDDGGSGSATAQVTVTAPTGNQAPTVTVPGAQAAFEDVDLALRGVSVGDADGDALVVALRVAHGTLTVRATAGVAVAGNGTGLVVLFGSAADLNAVLATLVYRGQLNFSGADALTVAVSDGRRYSAGRVSIVVKSAADQTADLQAAVAALRDAGVLTRGQANSLIVKLNLKGNHGDIGKVQAFLNEVETLSAAGVLTRAQADALLGPGRALLLSVTRR